MQLAPAAAVLAWPAVDTSPSPSPASSSPDAKKKRDTDDSTDADTDGKRVDGVDGHGASVDTFAYAVEIREAAGASGAASGDGSGDGAKNAHNWGPWRVAAHDAVESNGCGRGGGGAGGGARATYTCRVLSLRPGVRYSVRFTSSPRSRGDRSGGQSSGGVSGVPLGASASGSGSGSSGSSANANPVVPPSLALDFETPPTPPAAPQPPALASRSKAVLNLRWKPPSDDGGRRVAEFRLACSPPPRATTNGKAAAEGVRVLTGDERDAAALPGEGDGEEWAMVYDGGSDLRLRLAGLSPGVRYALRLQAVNAAGPSR